MTDEDLRLRMAELVVEALEVGTGKRERDVINEFFDSFGLDINELDARYPRGLPGRIRLLRKRAASSLAGAAPTAAALLNEIVRCGGRFVAMLDEVYARLSQHTSTTEGTSETFRLERGGVDEEQLTISPAFIEKVRHLSRFLRTIEIGRIDEDAVGSLIGWDGGESYGHWPVVDRNGGFRLTDAVLHLAWITPAVDQRASQDTAWARIRPAVDAARISADRMVAAAERLVRAHVAYLDMLLDADAETAEGLLFSNEPDQWRQDEVANEPGGRQSPSRR